MDSVRSKDKNYLSNNRINYEKNMFFFIYFIILVNKKLILWKIKLNNKIPKLNWKIKQFQNYKNKINNNNNNFFKKIINHNWKS